MAPDDVVQHVGRPAICTEHADDGIDRLRSDSKSLADELRELLEQHADLPDRGVVTLGRDLVPAQEDARAGALGERPENGIALGAELARKLVRDREREGRHAPQGSAAEGD